MITVTDISNIRNISDNNIIGGLPTLVNSEIKFAGKDNVLFFEEGVTLKNSTIAFQGSNSVVYIGKNSFSINITVFNNSVFRIGKNTYINGRLTSITSEEKHIFFGDDCMISFGVSIRVADPHLIYNTKTLERINYSKSVFIGDHVWIGQSVLLLKGTQIFSGSIIGANSVVSGKTIPSNTSWGGNPAREIAHDIFWDSPCVHAWTNNDTIQYKNFAKGDRYVYSYSDYSTISFDYIDNLLTNARTSGERLDILMQISKQTDKNRFAK